MSFFLRPGVDRNRFNNQLAQAGAGIQWRRHWDLGGEPSGGSAGTPRCQPEDWSSPQGNPSREEANGHGHEAEGSGNARHDGRLRYQFFLCCVNSVVLLNLSVFAVQTNEKGQVVTKTSLLKQMEELIEEPGLTCCICREGYKFQVTDTSSRS